MRAFNSVALLSFTILHGAPVSNVTKQVLLLDWNSITGEASDCT